MIKPADLANCLWKPFLEDISRGGPVYFTFSADLVRALLSQEGYAVSDPVLEVCETARQLYFISGDEAVLYGGALDVGTSGRSFAIILVCQQVLAVESMVRDPSGFSEHAYFPRLRRLMSPYLEEIRTNPFQFAEFEAIWRALARDIRSIPGSSDSSITFRFGVESGVNKARAFPLSQALLTLEDLRVIALRGKLRLEKASPADIWRILKQLRYYLTRRARRLIDLGVFKERVVEQVLSYLKVAERTTGRQEQVRPAQQDIIVFRDTSDWFEEVYRAYLRAPDAAPSHDESQIQAELAKRMAGEAFLVFPLAELGDSWVCSNRSTAIEPGESFLLVGEPVSMSDLEQRLRQQGVESTQFSSFDGLLGTLGPYAVTQRALVAGASQVTVRNGRVASVDQSPGAAKYRWAGGLSVDARGLRFLREYLPARIEFSDAEFTFQQLEAVNGRYMSAASFISSLASATGDTSFEMDFPGAHMARLTVAISRLPKEAAVGYPVGVDGSLEIGLVGAAAGNRVVSGFSETVDGLASGFDVRSCAMLLKALRARVGQEVPRAGVEGVCSRVRASKVPEAVRSVMLRLLAEKVRLPSKLCLNLGINCD